MTEKIYEKDAYLKNYEARIVGKKTEGNDIYVQLDKSIFFPEGGGQPSDLGMIGDAKVLDVSEKDGILQHKVDKVPEGEIVRCVLDWNRRLDNMQQHCGEHIISGIILKEYGGNNCGFHVGSEFVTIDIDIKEITIEMLRNIENKANEIVYKNLPVNIFTVQTLEEAKKHPLRKALKVNENIRVVEIDGVDCVACCGSHPKSTGEIGLIKIIKTESYKGMTRIYLKSGMRAFTDYQNKNSLILTLNQRYSAEDATLIEKINIESEKYKLLQNEYSALKRGINKEIALSLIKSSKDKLIAKVLDSISDEDLTRITKLILLQGDYVVLLGLKGLNKVILAHNGNSKLHCGKIFKEHIAEFNGRGGGGDLNAQGLINDEENLIGFINNIKEVIKQVEQEK